MIDKLNPRELNSDIEERLAPGDIMIDAVNVMFGEDGDNSDGVLKNVRGNTAITAPLEDTILARKTAQEDMFDVRTIGSVKDDVNGMIYWFVCSVSATDPQEHCIIQQNVSEDTYTTVLEADFLAFDPDSLVKGDVISGYFGDSKVLQTILYFTDGINPPRKINIDRQLSTGYADNEDIIQVIKPGPLGLCDGQFDTDTEFDSNNLSDSGFQFATQYIYIDGEESAISPYSRLLVGRGAIFKNMNVEDTGVHPLVDNTLNVTLNTVVTKDDVKKVRLLARTGIDAPFLVVDEFQIDKKKSINIGDRLVTIYDPATNVYKFYNDTYYAAVPSSEKNKLYDNVPLTAKTQTIVGNRLVYGNYTEGRTNNDENTTRGVLTDDGGNGFSVGNTPDWEQSAQGYVPPGGGPPTFEVINSDADAAENNLIADDINFDTHITQNTGSSGLQQRIDVDFNGLFGGDVAIPAGTLVTVDIPYRPTTGSSSVYFDVDGQGYGLFNSMAFNAQFDQGGPGSQNWYYSMRMKESNLGFTIPGDNIVNDTFKFVNQNIKTEFLIGNNSSVADVASKFKSEVEEVEQTIRVSLGSTYNFRIYDSQGNWTDEQFKLDASEGDVFMDLTFKFLADIQNQTTVRIKPYLHYASLVNGSFFRHPPLTALRTSNEDGGANFSVCNTIQNQDVVFRRNWNWYNGPSNDSDYEWTTSPNDNTPVSDFIADGSVVTATSYGTVAGFKAGCWHNFGVVYYDKFGRSGFVNEIGRTYVPWFSDPDRWPEGVPGGPTRIGPDYRGPSQIKINFRNYLPPAWATHYQVVYSGRGSVGDFTQYAVGKAFISRRKNDAFVKGTAENSPTGAEYTSEFDNNSRVLYVQLKTLDLYQEEKSTQRKYSFKEGDKLRLIRGKTGGDPENNIYWSASDGTPIEFDVVGVEYFDQAGYNNPIDRHPGNSNGNEDYIGTFLKLSAPHLEAGVSEIDSNDDLVYGDLDGGQGWEWQFVAPATATQDGVNGVVFGGVGEPKNTNLWGRETIVEIYSPKKRTEADVYYEIGHRFPISYDNLTYTDEINPINGDPFKARSYLDGTTAKNPHHRESDGVVISNGDIIFRKVPVKTPVYDSVSQTFRLYLEGTEYAPTKYWEYRAIALECDTINEVITSKDWSRGRPHAVFAGARTTHEENGLSYSEAWEQSTSNLLFSSFNPTLANFDNVERSFGSIQYLGSLDSNTMYCLQENKFSIIPVDQNIIQQSNGNSIAALSTSFINTPRYSAEDFGCGLRPESVSQGESMILFVDPSKKVFVQYIGGQLVPISDKGIASALTDEFELFDAATGWKRVLTGLKPDNNLAFFSIRHGVWNDPDGKTWAYNYAGRNWSSRYSFLPDAYNFMDNTMYTARYTDEDDPEISGLQGYILWSHDSDVYNTFYDEQEDSSISIVSKDNPSMVKAYNAISYEGNANNWTAEMTTNLDQQVAALNSGSFTEREGGYYSPMERDSSAGSSSHIVGIGVVQSQDGSEITFKNKVSNINIPSNSLIQKVVGGELVDIGDDVGFSSVTGIKKITLSGTSIVVNEDDELVAVGTSVLDGDHARGHFATITMTNNSTNQIELYCVNSHVTESKNNHRRGQ